MTRKIRHTEKGELMRAKLFRALVPIAVAVTTVGLVAGCSSGDTGPNADAPASFDSGAQINPHPISDLQQGGNMTPTSAPTGLRCSTLISAPGTSSVSSSSKRGPLSA